MVRFGIAAAVLAMMAAPLFAQESTESLKKELEQLRAEVDSLKAVNSTKELPAQGKIAADSMAADDNPVMTLFKGTKLSGFVDVGYQFSFNQLNTNGTPIRSATGNNPVRIFDTQDNSFYLHEAHITLERLANKDMIVGYHIELAAGHDPQIYDGAALDLQEGWLQIVAPVGSGLDIRVGKMAMLCGYEVLENMNNMNYSRGMVFGIIQPFTSTGIRVSYGFGGANNDMVVATMGFSNGFNFGDRFADQDHGKMLEMQIAARPIKDLLISATFLVDNDTSVISGSTNDGHYMFDLVAAYTMDKLTFALNYTQHAAQGSQAFGGVNRAFLSGIAIYTKYAWTDSMASALRVEYFSDQHGVLLTPAAIPSDSGDGARVFEFTLTQEIKVANQLIIRIEFRHDNANNHVFLRNDKVARGDNTLGFEAILPF